MAKVWQPALENELERLSQGFKKRVQAQCHGSSSDTTANKINPYYLIG